MLGNSVFGKLRLRFSHPGSIERVKIPTSSFGKQSDSEDHKRIGSHSKRGNSAAQRHRRTEVTNERGKDGGPARNCRRNPGAKRRLFSLPWVRSPPLWATHTHRLAII